MLLEERRRRLWVERERAVALWLHRACALTLAVGIALSRVVLGLHYPSDVLVGAAIGWSTAMFMLVIV